MIKKKIGLMGVGHLGKIHLKCILATDCWELVGFYDPSDENAASVSAQYALQRYTDAEALIRDCDALDIVTPTPSHYDMAEKALSAGRHVFIEKPITHSLEEGQKLLQLADKHKLKIQVGHVERFNPAVLALADMPLKPMFIEGHRLAAFQPRGTEVSVILDLMIHDLDLALHLTQSTVKSVSASGVAVLSRTPDIANARIEFENGCVANLTASRISMKQMRKMRLFQQDHYISLDFFEKNAQIVRLYEPDDPDLPNTDDLMAFETNAGKKWLKVYMPDVQPVNAIQRELESFYQCIAEDKRPVVNGQDGYNALELAHRILQEIQIRHDSLS